MGLWNMKNASSDINRYEIDINCGKFCLRVGKSHVSSQLREGGNRGALFLMENLFLQQNLSAFLPDWTFP